MILWQIFDQVDNVENVAFCVQAQLALGQFYVTDKMTRQQYFYLNLLEPEPHSPEESLPGKFVDLQLTQCSSSEGVLQSDSD